MSGGWFYERLEETGTGGMTVLGRYRATGHTVGPWARHLQHAGPPTALLMRAVQMLGHSPPDGLVARLTCEILAPLPVTDLVVQASVRRPGRKVAWATARLATADDPDTALAHAQAWVVRRTHEPLDIPATPLDQAPPSGRRESPPPGWHGGYLDAVAWSPVQGSFAEPGAATVWTSLLVDLVDGEPPTGAQRAAVVADAGSGISAVADPQSLVFVNTELTIHLLREPRGPAVWMDAQTILDPHGVGLARTRLGDVDGEAGAAAQTLFVEPR